MKINEIFGPTIQGEGKSTGRKVMFIRLGMCNLHCVWCDTPYTWNWIGTPFKHPLKFDKNKEIHEMSVLQVLEQLKSMDSTTKAVVISGGEPLLQQPQLLELIYWLKLLNYWVEVETNGTIVPSFAFFNGVDQINCSPKLSNCGDPENIRLKPKALEALAASPKTTFKFVVATDGDITEILQLVETFGMKQVYLMPEGVTKEEQLNKQDKVKALCDKYGFIFSPRVHIIELGGGRGI